MGMVMDDAATDGATFAEAVVFLSHFKDLKDPRQQGKVSYPLDEILLLCLFAVLAGAECFTEIALFGVNPSLTPQAPFSVMTLETSCIWLDPSPEPLM